MRPSTASVVAYTGRFCVGTDAALSSNGRTGRRVSGAKGGRLDFRSRTLRLVGGAARTAAFSPMDETSPIDDPILWSTSASPISNCCPSPKPSLDASWGYQRSAYSRRRAVFRAIRPGFAPLCDRAHLRRPRRESSDWVPGRISVRHPMPSPIFDGAPALRNIPTRRGFHSRTEHGQSMISGRREVGTISCPARRRSWIDFVSIRTARGSGSTPSASMLYLDYFAASTANGRPNCPTASKRSSDAIPSSNAANELV